MKKYIVRGAAALGTALVLLTPAADARNLRQNQLTPGRGYFQGHPDIDDVVVRSATMTVPCRHPFSVVYWARAFPWLGVLHGVLESQAEAGQVVQTQQHTEPIQR